MMAVAIIEGRIMKTASLDGQQKETGLCGIGAEYASRGLGAQRREVVYVAGRASAAAMKKDHQRKLVTRTCAGRLVQARVTINAISVYAMQRRAIIIVRSAQFTCAAHGHKTGFRNLSNTQLRGWSCARVGLRAYRQRRWQTGVRRRRFAR